MTCIWTICACQELLQFQLHVLALLIIYFGAFYKKLCVLSTYSIGYFAVLKTSHRENAFKRKRAGLDLSAAMDTQTDEFCV
jgi:hypothetical protein